MQFYLLGLLLLTATIFFSFAKQLFSMLTVCACFSQSFSHIFFSQLQTTTSKLMCTYFFSAHSYTAILCEQNHDLSQYFSAVDFFFRRNKQLCYLTQLHVMIIAKLQPEMELNGLKKNQWNRISMSLAEIYIDNFFFFFGATTTHPQLSRVLFIWRHSNGFMCTNTSIKYGTEITEHV